MSEFGPTEEFTAAWLVDGGEMGGRIREKDWSGTPLGPLASWPPGLRTTINLCLASNVPLAFTWGPRHTLLYNDGYRALCGARHPGALGQGIDEVWASSGSRLGPLFTRALAGTAVSLENEQLFLERNGFLEETFFSFSFSPLRDEGGSVRGVWSSCTETTRSVLGERRSHLLRGLTASLAGAQCVDEVFTRAATALEGGTWDLPFVLFYLRGAPNQPPRLLGSVGLAPGQQAPEAWPFEEVWRTGETVRVRDLEKRFGPLRCGPYPESPRVARMLPLTPASQEKPLALLVVGVSTRLALDEPLLDFHALLTACLTHALERVRARRQQLPPGMEEFNRAGEGRALNLYDQHMRQLFNRAPAAIAIVSGPDHVFEFANSRFELLAPHQSFLGKSIREVFPGLVEQGFIAMLEQVRLSGDLLNGRELHLWLDRQGKDEPEESFFNLILQPFYSADGRIKGVVCVLFDVTDIAKARGQLEQRAAELEAVIESIPDGVCISDTTGIIRANQVALDTLGPDKLLEPSSSLNEAVRRALQGETSTREFQVRHARTAQERIIRSATAPVRLRERIVGAVSINTDITERNHAEKERELLLDSEQAARREAERANRMKDEFLARVSHELATPLVSMRMWLELLRADERKRPEALAGLRHSAQAQTKLVHDLLDTSRALNGKLNVALEACEPVDALRAAMADIEPVATHKQISLELRLEETPLVLADSERLRQMVSNLLSNAVKFTPAGGRVWVSLERKQEGVCIVVRDTGKGFPAEFQPLLFAPFRQEEEGTTRTSGGLGLGLAIVRQLVELHQGKVWAESPGRGQGATFTLWLPPFGDVEEEARPESLEPALRYLEGLHLLLVEDDALTRTAVASVLEQHGAEVVAVESAATALEALRGGRFDAMLCDIAMPGEDGYSLIRKVRAMDTPLRQLPAAAFTAHMRQDDRLRALAAGFQMHIPKSIETAQLIAHVRLLARGSLEETRRK